MIRDVRVKDDGAAVVVDDGEHASARIVVLEKTVVARHDVDEGVGKVDRLHVEKRMKDGMGDIDLDWAIFG